jgi:hypothetical protein
MLTACALLLKEAALRKFQTRLGEVSERRIAWLTTATGFILGVLVSISSVGAGALAVTALILLYPKLPTLRIVGSDIAHAVPLTFVAGMGHWWFGSVDLQLFVSLIAGSIPGILIGSYVAKRIPEKLLRFSLAGILALVASRFVFG